VTRDSKLVLIAASHYIMDDETEAGSSGASDRGGHPPGSDGLGSPLQARAKFLKNWSWDSVVSINRGACERGRAQHGVNSETHRARAQEWEQIRDSELTLAEVCHHLRNFHRGAPFLFFNGNTFATIARELTFVIFSDLPASRKREISSAVAHYVAGVLDWRFAEEIVHSLTSPIDFEVGDRVKTFRGTSHGTIVRILEDGRVVWKSDGSSAELIAMPESLIRLK
jgi:hypothetical protein